MEHRISVTAEGMSAGALARELEGVPGTRVRERERGSTEQLALDPASVSLIVAGAGTVKALITALATVWSARAKAKEAAPPGVVVHLHTDADEVRVTVGADGVVVSTSGRVPEDVEEITDIHLAAAPSPASG